MRTLDLIESEIDDNQIFLFQDSAGFYSQVLIGNLEDLKRRVFINDEELEDLLKYGVFSGVDEDIWTYEWKLGSIIDTGKGRHKIIGVFITHFPNRVNIDLEEVGGTLRQTLDLKEFTTNLWIGHWTLLKQLNRTGNRKLCTCNSLDLFRFGCKCGGI